MFSKINDIIYYIKKIVKNQYKFFIYTKIERQWGEKNTHNNTYIDNTFEDELFPIHKVTVGNYTYGPLRVRSYSSNDEQLKIGSFCSIARGVIFILGGMHRRDTLTTFPVQYFFKNETDSFSKGAIIIEDDVWISSNSVILSGCKIGKGTIIAANSVVTKSTEPYVIVAGNPARVIGKRFDENLIEKLMKLNFSNISNNFVLENMEYFTSSLNENIINEFVEKMKKI